MIYDFHMFPIDRSLRICEYPMGKLMTEVLKMVKKVENILELRVLGKPSSWD